MATVVEAAVPTDRFALGDTFDAVPDTTFEPVQITATGDSNLMPFLWASAPDLDALHDAIRSDSTVKDGQWIARHEDHNLYHIECEAPIRYVIAAIVEEQGTVLHSRERRAAGSASCSFETALRCRRPTTAAKSGASPSEFGVSTRWMA